jgi:hypothetical protein
MLKLDHPPMFGLYIRNVLRAIGIEMYDFLPSIGELVLPVAVPFGLGLPPRIAPTAAAVSPMPNPDFSAPGHHWLSAGWTLSGKARLRFVWISVYERKFHTGIDNPCPSLHAPSPAA